MTKKHYIAIAREFKRVTDGETWIPRGTEVHYLASQLASVMAADNLNFNRSRFMTACGFVND